MWHPPLPPVTWLAAEWETLGTSGTWPGGVLWGCQHQAWHCYSPGEKKNLGLIHDSGVERARERQRAVFRCDTGEPRVPLHMGVTAGFVPWLWNLEVEPLPCSPEDLTRATETKELLRVRVELSSEKVCSIIVLCYLGFKNYLLQILGQDREEQGHVKIIFASTLCLAWCARLATFHSFLPDRGKCSQGNAKLRNYLEESSGAVK